MNAGIITFSIVLPLLLSLAFFFDQQSGLLREDNYHQNQRYSWSKVQMAWWTIIIISSLTGIIARYVDLPELNPSTLMILGFSSATLLTANIMERAETVDQKNPPKRLLSNGFIIDILSQGKQTSVARAQAIMINLILGLWFILKVALNLLHFPGGGIDTVMPVFITDNLVLLGISSATYAVMKSFENKEVAPDNPVKQYISPPGTVTPTNGNNE